MNKKGGIFFILDAFLASGIITIALLAVLSASKAPNVSVDDNKNMLINYMDFFENTKVYAAQGEIIEELLANGNISNKEENLFQAITELMIKNKTTNATNLVREQTNIILPIQYGIKFKYNNITIYNRSTNKITTAKQSFSRKKIINYYEPPRSITKKLANINDSDSPFDDDCKTNFGSEYDCVSAINVMSKELRPSMCYESHSEAEIYNVTCNGFEEGKLHPPIIIEVTIWL